MAIIGNTLHVCKWVRSSKWMHVSRFSRLLCRRPPFSVSGREKATIPGFIKGFVYNPKSQHRSLEALQRLFVEITSINDKNSRVFKNSFFVNGFNLSLHIFTIESSCITLFSCRKNCCCKSTILRQWKKKENSILMIEIVLL